MTDAPVLEGIIDLVFEDPSGGLVIVDYKTDRLDRSGALEEAAAPYIAQLGAYALATERVTGRQVTEAVIVFASRAADGAPGEYGLPDLAAAKARALTLASATVPSPWEGRGTRGSWSQGAG